MYIHTHGCCHNLGVLFLGVMQSPLFGFYIRVPDFENSHIWSYAGLISSTVSVLIWPLLYVPELPGSVKPLPEAAPAACRGAAPSRRVVCPQPVCIPPAYTCRCVYVCIYISEYMRVYSNYL